MSMSPELQQDIADVEAGAERVTRPGRWRVERKDGRITVEMFDTGPEEREDRERQMTQAPTPGPLSAESSYISGCVIVPRTGDPVLFTADNNGVVTVRLNKYAIVPLEDYGNSLPCLAPTAPVEASGLERVVVGRDALFKLWNEASSLLSSSQKDDVAKALRPQPSGETREVSRSEIEEAIENNLRVRVNEADKDIIVNTAECVDAILALLSARPLALGGQHSTATDFPPDDVLACDITPARAEAQDEWAADALRFYALGQQDNGRRAKEALARAHPSPTPAADADRVRIAVKALEWIDSNKSIAPVWVQRKVRDTLAALKSTAAK